MLGKILSLLTIGEAVTGLHLARRFVVECAAIVSLAVLGAILTAALMILGFYEFYQVLTSHGLDGDIAMLVTGACGLFALILIVAVLIDKTRRIKSFPLNVSVLGSTGLASAQSLWRGFQRGFTKN